MSKHPPTMCDSHEWEMERLARLCDLLDQTLQLAFEEVSAGHSNQSVPVRPRNEFVSEISGGVRQ